MFKFIDLFAWIWWIRQAFTNLWGKCVFSLDRDKYCSISYKENYWEELNWDITQVKTSDIPDFDILTGWFPCQPFSIAWVSSKNFLWLEHWFKDIDQWNLFFEIARIVKDKQPKALFLENVKNLQSHDKWNTFNVIYETLTKLWYNVYYKVINAKYYVPQNRERIVIIWLRRDIFNNIWFFFPNYPSKRLYELNDIIENKVDDKYTLSDKLWNYLKERKEKMKMKWNGFWYWLIDPKKDDITRTISARYYKDGSEVLIKQNNKNPRKLTPRECARLMWFPEDFKIVVSDIQAYKQFGNSVVIPAMQSVADILVKYIESVNNWKLDNSILLKYLNEHFWK